MSGEGGLGLGQDESSVDTPCTTPSLVGRTVHAFVDIAADQRATGFGVATPEIVRGPGQVEYPQWASVHVSTLPGTAGEVSASNRKREEKE